MIHKDINDFFVNYFFSTNFCVEFYGYNNTVIDGPSRLFNDDISILQTLDDPIRGRRIDDTYISTSNKLKKKKKSSSQNCGNTNKKKNIYNRKCY